MKNLEKFGFGLCGILVATYFWTAHNANPEHASKPSDTELADHSTSDIRTLRERTRAVERKLAKLEQIAHEAALDSATGPALHDDGDDESDEDGREERSDIPKLSPEEHDVLLVQVSHEVTSEALASQRPNAKWTQEASLRLDDVLAVPELAGSSAVDVECAETRCRFRIRHERLDAFKTFRDWGMSSNVFNGNMFFDYDKDTKETTIYLAKAGTELPRPEHPLL